MNFNSNIGRFLSLIIVAFALSGAVSASENVIAITPQPNRLTAANGHFTFTPSSPIHISSAFDKKATEAVSQFISGFNAVTTTPLTSQIIKSSKVAVGGISIKFSKQIPPEGYKLDITEKGITIAASTHNGVFYAFQTLKQLLSTDIFGKSKSANVQWSVPCLSITDAPQFAYRGMMIDVARHFFGIDEMKRILDVMAAHKLNTLHWHLTDDQGWRVEIKKYPKLTSIGSIRNKTMIAKEWDNYDTTPYGGFFTQEQIKEIVKYAQERCITVIPEIDLPGHMMAALASYPELGCTGGPYEVSGQWGVRDDVLCPGKEVTFTFLEDVLTEILDLFPSKYIHIGGDETPKIRWEKCPLCQKRIHDLGLKSNGKHSAEFFLQSYVTKRVENFLNKHGRSIIGWDEILEGELAPNATVMSWRGMDGGIEAAKQKHDAIMTPSSHLYFDYYPTLNTQDEPLAIGGYNPIEKVYSLNPVPESLNEQEKKHIIGVQANLWAEYITSGSQLEYMLLPRLAALSEVQWTNPAQKDYSRFLTNLGHTFAIYDKMGLNYGKHVYEIDAKYDVPGNDGKVSVSLSTLGDTPIFYTLDGSDPDDSSLRYTAPIAVTHDVILKAKALRENVETRMFKKIFSFNKATGRKFTLNSTPTPKYTFNGASILTDGLNGDFNYSTGYWLGFFNEPLDGTIDFGKNENISSVNVSYMIQVGEYVLPPVKITVWAADGQGNLAKVGEKNIPVATKDVKDGIAATTCSFPTVNTRQLRIVVETTSVIPDWHGAHGEKAHLFIDEITVK